jgi:hypothetical protein
MTNASKIELDILKGKGYMDDLLIDERIILKLTSGREGKTGVSC